MPKRKFVVSDYVWINSLDTRLSKCGPWALFRQSVEQAHHITVFIHIIYRHEMAICRNPPIHSFTGDRNYLTDLE
jgi:hypothetical protein